MEVLVAFAIFSITVTVIIQLFSAGFATLWKSEDYVAASVRANMSMRELMQSETLSEDNRSENTPDGYRIDTTVSEVLGERTKHLPWRMLQVTIVMSWWKKNKERTIQVRGIKLIKKEIAL